MSRFEDYPAPCAIIVARHKGDPDWKSPWDAGYHGEKVQDMLRRHLKAKTLCARCPLLDVCEEMLTDHEIRGIPIGGVVAGRFSDVLIHNGGHTARQGTCCACKKPMTPRRPGRRAGRRNHVGEGLCHECFPHYSRAARKKGHSA